MVIFQRVSGEYPLSLVRIAKLLGKVVIYDLDDDLDQLPESHPGFSYYSNPESRKIRKEICREADALFVASPVLQERYSKNSPRVLVVPNCINPDLAENSAERSSGTPVRIGYFGTRTHREDLEIVVPAMEKILQECGEAVEFVFLGEYPEKLKGRKGIIVIPEERDYSLFFQNLWKLHLDIGLAPLQNTSFNEAKSSVKVLQYAFCESAVIASDVSPYRQVITPNETGILCQNSHEAWYASLKLLVENPSMRKRLAEKGKQMVLDFHTLEKGASQLIKLLQGLLREKGRVPAGDSVPLVSIIIPVYNKGEYTRQCLEALFQNTPSQPRFEVVVVDNASSDDTPEVLKHFPVRVISNKENLGFSKGCNQGAREAKGSYLLFLNNDTIPLQGWLSPLVRKLQDDPEVAIAGSKLVYPGSGKIQHAGLIFSDTLVFGYPAPPVYHLYEGLPHGHPIVNKERAFQAVTGACLMIRKEMFFRAGAFDEGFQNGYEDVDLCLKVKRMGFKVMYIPASMLFHYGSATLGKNAPFYRNGKRLLDRWGEMWSADDLKYYEEDEVKREMVVDNEGLICEVKLFWKGAPLG